LKTLLAKFPNAPQVHDMVGTLALATNDTASARMAWDRALAIDPENVDALGGIAALDTAAKKPAQARAFIEARLAKQPDRPGLLLLAAKVRMATGDTAGTEAALKKLLEVDPQNLQAYGFLGQIYVKQKRIADAKREYAAVIRQRPRSVPAHTMLGLLAEAENDIPRAIEWYQKAVQLDWRAAVASNNLAWIYATRDTNLDIALQLAESASGATPTQAEFFDTLGWIYYKKQVSTMAIRTLKRAVDLDASNPVHQYHLGMAYALEGQDKLARRTLQTALKLGNNFEGAETARQVLATLVY
jgi:Tfp pilus assembly protein PilF